MNLSFLKQFDLVYVGTPYSKYPGGIELAFAEACKLTARLMLKGVKVYSPIAHTHPLAIHGGIDPLDHSIWLPFDSWIMAKSDALLVAMMTGWEESHGIQTEIATFASRSPAIFLIDPVDLQIWRCSSEIIEKCRAERSSL